eukprot:TRINITY_DN67928_c2_g3_i1.p1 TRINITY_DN67928_c2_g3~~TRINITY_DN67928_c2_g3_i1.p1  ORF type:complete len:458 (+),score=225.25 TRINITY_DN67928_c2_g3_i1:50-1375(+)
MAELLAKSVWTQFKMFCLVVYRRAKPSILTAYEHWGIQISLGTLLLAAFARSNVLSLIYVMVIIGSYVVSGRKAVSRMWALLVVLLWTTLGMQYFLSIGSPPKANYKYPWEEAHMSAVNQRWLMLGGYTSQDLNWDFFALFFACLQIPHFARSKNADRLEGLEQGLGIDGSYEQSAEDDEQFVVGDPEAWYNTAWPTARFWFYLAVDKIVILFIFFAATFRADLASFGYVYFTLNLLLRNDLYKGMSSSGEAYAKAPGHHALRRYLAHWRNLHMYNYFVMIVLIVFQVPWIVHHYVGTPPVRWENTLGLFKYASNDVNVSVASRALSSQGALHCIIIFVLVDVQFTIFSSDAYRIVLKFYDDESRLSVDKGRESARAQGCASRRPARVVRPASHVQVQAACGALQDGRDRRQARRSVHRRGGVADSLEAWAEAECDRRLGL